MSGLIDINTDTLNLLVNSARRANETINEASAKLRSITRHNNWNCRERDRINERTNENIANIGKLQNISYEYLNNIEASVTDFLNEENGISSLFESLESIISSVGAIQAAQSVINNQKSFTSTIDKIRESAGTSKFIKYFNNSSIKLWDLSSCMI